MYSLSSIAQLLLTNMNYPGRYLYWELNVILYGCDKFVESSTMLFLNPTKKSLNAAFGIDVGIKKAKLKLYLESYRSNY
jgi:hypothetical protein